ncbi:hypothetical protein WUBG_07940 [Wuchereria bancrofti]|uniref:CRIB domain-containing protein n=1 Tax=Wuchereria bancrofti TaxID=6293 RepID=J9B2J7_WUCBA|nr:hypothetical protein WUBG_07940 [Wuchereria bancrofti]
MWVTFKIQADENYKRIAESENIHITMDNISSNQTNQIINKKLLRKTAKVKPEEVSTPTHFEHLVHIEDIQSNANNFVATELTHDPIIRNIFNMIEKNIANTSSNAISAITPTDNDNNITELCVESMENQENNPKNVTVYINDIETYDNLNNFTLSSCASKISNDEKHQSIPHSLKSNSKKINNQNSIKSFLMLPKHKKLTSISSSDSIETTSSVSPFAPTSKQFQYTNVKNEETTCDAIISQKTGEMISSLYKNQDAININSMITDANSFEKKLIDLKDQMEIQQALKQLDDALDEQIATETCLTSSNSEKCNIEMFEEKTESTKLKDNKKSVKQLVEILDSKQLQFKTRNMPPKLINQDSDLTSDNEGNTKTKASLYISDPEITPKPSLIGVNIFGLNDGKSIAEIIAEKRNYENYSLHKRPPTSPKSVLKKPLPIPKPSTSDEGEQKWLLPSSSNQVIHPSDISLTDNRNSKIQAKQQKISNSEMPPTIIKIDNIQSSTNFQSTTTDATTPITTTTTTTTTTADVTSKDSNQQRLHAVKYSTGAK